MKKLSIWEYTCSVISLNILLFVMALISGEKLSMRDGLRVVYLITLPLIIIRTYKARGIYYIYCVLYALLAIYLFK